MSARILIVEDNTDNLKLMSYLLKASGYQLFTAMDGEEALETVTRERPDLVVCDVQIPKIDGYGVAQRLKNHPALRSIPLVAVTALAMVGDRDKMLSAGFDGYISKPLIPQTFVKQLEAFLNAEERRPPRTPHKNVPETPRAPSNQPHKATILVVDDSRVNLNLVRSTLEPFGYSVVAAQSVQEGLSVARQQRPDLIL